MSKRLILVRHGNAKSGTYGVADFDRALSTIGVNEAQEMAFRIKNRDLMPQAIISSPALRAISTARIFAGIWGRQAEEILTSDTAYASSVSSLLRIVNGIENDVSAAVLFGHNPELSTLADYLTEAGVSPLPTCGVVIIDFDLNDWHMVSKGLGTMLLFDYPGADHAL